MSVVYDKDLIFFFNPYTTSHIAYLLQEEGDPFQGLKLGSCLRNELSKETHLLTKQEILLGKGARVESSRVRNQENCSARRLPVLRVLW